jgi:hypothetical protein
MPADRHQLRILLIDSLAEHMIEIHLVMAAGRGERHRLLEQVPAGGGQVLDELIEFHGLGLFFIG